METTVRRSDTPGGAHDIVIRGEGLNLDPLHAAPASGIAARIELDVAIGEQGPGDSRCTSQPPRAPVPAVLHCR